MSIRAAPTDRDPEELLEFGVVVIDKPAGPTSHQVSSWIGDMTQTNAGHVGTLDPAVTGTLPVLLGKATRLAQALTTGHKGYVAILEVHDELPTDWRETIDRFEGTIYQRPPRKSAVARRLRERTIHHLEVVERRDRRLLLEVRCEAGTYIRKLCHDIGLALGTGAHMASLRRTESDPFDDRSLVSLHDLTDAIAFWQEDGDEAALAEVVRPAEDAIDHLPQVTIAPSAAEEVVEGAPVYAPGVLDIEDGLSPADRPLVACVVPNGTVICLGRLVGEATADRGTVVDLERVLI